MSFSPTNANPLQNSAVDRGCLSPDSKTIYLPSGESVDHAFWYEIDVPTHSVRTQLKFADDEAVPHAHNTICGRDGRVFMAATAAIGSDGKADNEHSLKIYTPGLDEATNPGSGSSSFTGPFSNRIRPFTINGSGSLVFANIMDFVGFEVGDTLTGQLRYTAQPTTCDGGAYPEPIHRIQYRATASQSLTITARCGSRMPYGMGFTISM
jgi:hypothetical protein